VTDTLTLKKQISVSPDMIFHAEFDRVYKTGMTLCKYSQPNMTKCMELNVQSTSTQEREICTSSSAKVQTSRSARAWRNNGSAIHPNATYLTVIKANYSNIESGLKRLFYQTL